MSSLVAPRYESPVIYSDTGRMSREWYQFLVNLAKAIGASPTSTDDTRLTLEMDEAVESGESQATDLSLTEEVLTTTDLSEIQTLLACLDEDPILVRFTAQRDGLVPASGGGTTTYLRADGSFAAPAVLGRLDAFKATDQTITSSTTLTNDADLSVPVAASTYDFEIFLAFYEVTLGTGGFQFDLAGGSSTVASILWGADGYVTAVAGNPAATAANTAQSYGSVATASSAPSWVRVTGQVSFSGAGTFIVRWAQASISVNGTTLKAKSFMTLQKVA